MRNLLLMFVLVTAFGVAHAERFQDIDPEDFLKQRFGSDVPSPQMLWIDAELGAAAEMVLGHPYLGRRLRYWRDGDTTVWIIDEIGMKKPITMGVEVHDGQIQDFRILVFREERGGEVRSPEWLATLQGLSLTEDHELNREIDGVTGATLSVGSVNRVSKLALVFHQYVLSGS